MRYVYGADGNVAATIDSSGRVTLGLEPSAIVGLVQNDVDVFSDEAGADWLGRINADRRIFDARHEFVGSVDVIGRVLDMTGRLVGTVSQPIDGAALLLLVGGLRPETLAGPSPPAEAVSTMMDEVISLSEENAAPGIRKNYKPLTDEELFGKPHKKK